MSAILLINLDALLHRRGVEAARVEFKRSWDQSTTGPQVLRTICAFANDHHNLNGGYVVIGVEDRDGRAPLPPAGLSAEEVEAAQKWIRGNCNRLDPPYPPILSPEVISDRHILGAPSALRDAAHLRALGDDDGAFRRIESTWMSHQGSAVLSSEMIRIYAESGEVGRAEEVLKTFEAQGPGSAVSHIANTLIEALVKIGDGEKALRCSGRVVPPCSVRTLSTPPSWPDAPEIPTSRTGTSSAPATRYMPTRGRCWSSRRPSSGWRRKPTGGGNVTRTAISHGGSGAAGARHPARCPASAPCLGVARLGAYAQLAEGAGSSRRRSLSQGGRSVAGRAEVRSGNGKDGKDPGMTATKRE